MKLNVTRLDLLLHFLIEVCRPRHALVLNELALALKGVFL